ncbi:MAG: hypothetical protein U0232_10690 [Thermomicrobiales bacterium]
MADPRAVDRVLARLKRTLAGRRARTLAGPPAARLAKALVHDPELLSSMNQPMASTRRVVEVRELLRDFAQQRVSSCRAIPGRGSAAASRIGIIHEGQLVEDMPAATLTQRLRQRLIVDARDREVARAALVAAGFAVTPGESGALEVTDAEAIARPDDIARLLVQAGVPPTHLLVAQDDLETHFLQLVRAARGHDA